MAVILKLNPPSGSLADARNIQFSLGDFDEGSQYRVSFENASLSLLSKVTSANCDVQDDTYLNFSGLKKVAGTLDLRLQESNENVVVTIFANVEKMVDGNWILSDIGANAFQIQHDVTERTRDRITVSPDFITPSDKATISVRGESNSSVHVFINGKKFAVRTNHKGEGSFSFRGIDVLSGTSSKSSTMQKFPILFARAIDDFKVIYQSASVLHYLPSKMKALQSAHADFDKPACVVFDASPKPGQTLNTLDDFCFKGAYTGSESIFGNSDSYYNSRVGFCGDINTANISPIKNAGTCRIFNSSSSVGLPNGSGLIAFSSSYDPTVDASFASDRCPRFTLASRVYVAHVPTSLRYRANPVRNGVILTPPKYYHTIFVNSVDPGEAVTIEFHFPDDRLVSIDLVTEHTADGTAAEIATLIRTNEYLSIDAIGVLRRGNEVDVYSENQFTVVTEVRDDGSSSIQPCYNTNRSIKILTDPISLMDEGSTLVFLDSQLGSQSYAIVGRDDDRILTIDVPFGVNNGVGPQISDNIYCQKFVIVDGTRTPTTEGLTSVNPLPYIKDKMNREIPAVYPSIAARTDWIDGNMYAYIVCQAPISNGSYQLFLTSFRLGDSPNSYGDWIQLTTLGENKNAVIRCDSYGNLHIVWESDRTGSTQVYYGCLGPGSKTINNQTLISVLEKHTYGSSSLAWFDDPLTVGYSDISPDFNRCLGGSGKASHFFSGGYNTFVVQGNPSEDAAMYVGTLASDPDAGSFGGNFSEMSYQMTFDLQILGLTDSILNDEDIANRFEEWKSQFTFYQDDKVSRANNVYTIENVGTYFDRSIPICGSFKFPDIASSVIDGGSGVDGYTNDSDETYIEFDTEAVSAHVGNIRHFMLMIMPEKVRFRAVNAETFFEYCDRSGQDSSLCGGYIGKFESSYYTGRFKMALVLATSENESSGQLAKKKTLVVRRFGDYFTFEKARKIAIGLHYTKASDEYVTSMAGHNKFTQEQNYRFLGDISVGIDGQVSMSQSFLADFSDQYRKFDIGFGFPHGEDFDTNDVVPFNGNLYDDVDVTIVFSNAIITKPTLHFDSVFTTIPTSVRDASQIFVAERTDSNINPSDELFSQSGHFESGLSEAEYLLSLDAQSGFSQIPITLSQSYQDRNPDICVDAFDKIHVVWQSNRHGNWDVFYSGSRDRSLPFRFDTRITDIDSSSIEPSIAVDSKGRRLIVWQDNREGVYQIFSASSSAKDDLWANQCKYDEADEYVWTTNARDPYTDPYIQTADAFSCQVSFEFEATETTSYHFTIDFYSDRDRTTLYKRISSKDSIIGWRVDDVQIASEGAAMNTSTSHVITYSVAREDSLSDRVLYATVRAENVATGAFSNADSSSVFSFYCPSEQASRCGLSFKYTNETDTEQSLHFRTTFYSDAGRKMAVLSTFTLLDPQGWFSGQSEISSSGVVLPSGDTVRMAYDPYFLPHTLYNAKNTTDSPIRQYLICGVQYYLTTEIYVNGSFTEIQRSTMLCPCSYTEASLWREDQDSKLWDCSGQSGQDLRVCQTSSDAVMPLAIAGNNDLIYIVWEDDRYNRNASGQSTSHDYFFGVWDTENNEMYSSGQGNFDRRITYYSDNSKALYNASVFVDQFQNLNTAFHDGFSMYSRACSIGCVFEPIISEKRVSPCAFTDGTDDSFYKIGNVPERAASQYMLMRVREPYVAYSTYLDVSTAVAVVSDCFIELDVVGVPGSYAIRLRNESDEDWTSWIRIGPPLPLQTGQEFNGEERKESDFFSARFIGKDRFIVPWFASPGNGMKKVCCEVLTFFGKTESFCVDFMAIYKELSYKVDFFFDSSFSQPVSKYQNIPVVGAQKTTNPITHDNLASITEDTTAVSEIFVRITFSEPEKLQLIERLKTLSRFASLDALTMSVYQQGLNDQLDLPLTMVSNGVYRGSFSIEASDGIFNVDGLAMVIVNIPGACRSVSSDQISRRLDKILTQTSLQQSYSVFNDMTLFREQYSGDDTRNSFGQPTYHKTAGFGAPTTTARGGDFTWPGGGSVVVVPPPTDPGGGGSSGAETGGTSGGGITGGGTTGGSTGGAGGSTGETGSGGNSGGGVSGASDTTTSTDIRDPGEQGRGTVAS